MQAINRRIGVQFTVLTFGIALLFSGALIVAGRFGYTVYNSVETFPQFLANVPFAIYILSPMIASYRLFVVERGRVGPQEGSCPC